MGKKEMIVGFVTVLLVTGINAQEEVDTMMKAEVYSNASGELLKYRIYVPDGISEMKKCPLMVFLHGSGERGDDNKSQLKHSAMDIVAWSKSNKEPVILIVPQCPLNMQWVNVNWSAETHNMPDSPAIPLRLVFELCDQVRTKYPVDSSRIYIAGLSMGGYGTWDAIQRKPNYFAAAIPVCGGGDDKQAGKIKNVPIWAFHGDKDTSVDPKRSRMMIEAIRKSGGNPKYTEYEGVGHNSWKRTFTNPEVLRWLFDKKRK